MTLLNELINTVHHGELSPRQRDLLIALLTHLAACSIAMTHCPEMINVQTTYRDRPAELQCEPATDRAPDR